MTHLSSLQIDALAAGQFAGSEADVARAHVASCARCRDDFAAAEAACAEFTRDVLPRTIGRLRAQPPWWRTLWPAIVVPALAAAALLLWSVRRPDVPGKGPDVQIKGSVTFQVFAKRGAQVIAVRDGTRLAAGDQIRFVAGGARYLLIASVDGNGRASVYYPYGGTRSEAIANKPSELPGSIVLDAAPGPERLFALFSREPLEATTVTRALTAIGVKGGGAIRATTSLDVPASAQVSIVFEKVAP
jgi:hypothetical protein